MLSRLKREYHPRHKPLLTRQSFSREMVTAATMPIAGGLTEGSVIAVLAEQMFKVNEFQFATIMAAPMFANVTSFIWSRLAHGRPKIRVIVWLQVLMLLSVTAIGFLPTGPTGSWMLVGLVVVSRCLIAGIVTLRSTLWRNNYPRAVRGKITGQFVQVAVVVLAISPLAVYSILDLNPNLFRFLYPLCAVIAVIGVVSFSKIRLRREKELLRQERAVIRTRQRNRFSLLPRGETEPVYSGDDDTDTDGEGETKDQSPSLLSFYRVLRDDRWFRKYMIWQFCAGAGNMMGEVAAIWWIIKLAKSTPDAYGLSVLLTTSIPMVFALVTLPLWGRLLDRMHITEFRVRHGMWWIIAQSAAFVCALTGLFWIWIIQRIFQGELRGGGMLAWQLGHNDFAKRNMVSTYMGIHVTLTGLRGALMPFAGTMLVAGFHDVEVLGWQVPTWDGIGAWVFVITTVLCVIAHSGYLHMSRNIPGSKPNDGSHGDHAQSTN